MPKQIWAWTGLTCVLLAIGCSGDTKSGRQLTNTTKVGTGGTTGTGAAPAGGSFGNGNGSSGNGSSGSGATPANNSPVLPVDPSAAPYVQDDTAMSGLDPGVIAMLKTGGGQCNVTATYPYEGTIFPGGLTPPVIMWTGSADAAYVHFAYDRSDKVDYHFAVKAPNPGELQIPRQAWNEITRRTNGAQLLVTLNVLVGGTVGSCQLHWRIAPGNMIGAIYYNTYQAPDPGIPGQGAVMRLSLGSTAEIYKQYQGGTNVIPMTGPCISCHSVSFNGTTLVASYHDYSLQEFRVEKYDVGMGTQPMASGNLTNANFGALTPDGKRILAMGNPQCTAGADTFPRRPNNFPLVEGAAVARMLDTTTGMDMNAAGLNKDFYMWMSEFSPNGDKVVFNHAKSDGMSGTDRSQLAVMDYDYATNTFANLKVIVSTANMNGVPKPSLDYSPAPAFGGVLGCGADMCGADGNMCTPNDIIPVIGSIPGIPGDVAALPMGSCTGPCYPAWPFFTPDGRAVIFSLISEPDFAQAFPGRDTPSLSELWYVDLETLEVVRLDKANTGLKDPDKQSNYYPTVMPVAVGGYFWVFWTALREYGDKLAGYDPAAPANAALDANQKRIWATAIQPKIDQKGEVKTQPGPLTDPSFPGFYVDGQSESGNVRAFAALNPCLANGMTCSSGLDCCCGYCLTPDGQDKGMCSCDVPKCAKINEKCKTTADCCPAPQPTDPAPMCLGGYCGFLSIVR
jgi:hypothetical protein